MGSEAFNCPAGSAPGRSYAIALSDSERFHRDRRATPYRCLGRVKTPTEVHGGWLTMVEPVSIACQMFIVPASVLFIALAVASTEALKALISLIALGISVLWIVRVWTWKQISTGDLYTALALALIFFVAALLTFFAHGNAWWRARNALPTGSRISGL